MTGSGLDITLLSGTRRGVALEDAHRARGDHQPIVWPRPTRRPGVAMARPHPAAVTADVVVVTYNSRGDLERCFASVERAAADIDARILVVDNGSGDGSLEFCLKRPAGLVDGIALLENRGYAQAINAAAACSSADYLIVLNPDVQIPDASALRKLIEHLEDHPHAAAAAPLLRLPDGSVQSSARPVPNLPMLFARQTPLGRTAWGEKWANRYLELPDADRPTAIEWAVGAALVCRRRDFERVGGWDGGFFLYFEDVDFCTRLRKAGRQVHFVPSVEMVHDHHQASARENGSALRSRARRAHLVSAGRFFRKHPRYAVRGILSDHPHLTEATRRLIDVTVAATLLVLLAPLMALIALLVRRSGPGPVLFRQERLGKDAKPFTMLKFRTMHAACDESLHADFVRDMCTEGASGVDAHGRTIFKISPDPRVTRVGRVLRSWSLDELPQLWNVLRGEMTLVGFRPPIPYELEHYRDWWYGRFSVKPGLTGLWQVSGRNLFSYEQMILLDVEYATRRSLALDLALLARTPVALLSRRGAV